MRRDADRPLFKDVVEGTVAHKDELEQTVSAALAQDWTWARIDRLVRAILLAGAYELVHRQDVPPRVAINEYVEIAHAFYDQGEPNFVNSVLDRVARQARSGRTREVSRRWRAPAHRRIRADRPLLRAAGQEASPAPAA